MSENLENIVIDTTATEQTLDDFEQELFSGKAPAPKPVENEEVVDDNVNDSTEEEVPVNDTTETLDEEGEEDEGDGPSEPPKKESRAEKRIRELVAKTRELERKLEEREAAKPVETPKSEEKTPAANEGSKAPHWDDVDAEGTPKYPLGQFDPQFNADLVRYTVQEEQRRIDEQRATTEQQRRMQEAEQAAQQEWESKLAPALERHPDFVEKGQELIDNFSDLEPNYAKYLTDTIRSIDNGPDVLYYLADNPELARDIVNKGPAMATVMLGRISAMFDDDSATQTNTQTKDTRTKVTKAPTPPPRVRGTALPKTKDLDNLDDFEEALFRSS